MTSTTEPETVDTLVVGSGFGGSVAAYRLAEAGREVVLLERGKKWPPGSFPRTPAEVGQSFWDPSEGRHGMYDVWSFEGIDAVVASGLGGGSLIYANVLLRKDEDWFQWLDPVGGGYVKWPFSRADLEPHYDHAESMLAPQQVPFDQPGYDLAKTRVFREAAEARGLDWQPVDLAVRFANDGKAAVPGEQLADGPYPNIHGSTPRRTCRLCGECDIGCNDGAKNTLDHTYLSAAAHHGADIRTRAEVRRIARHRDGGFDVEWVEHTTEGSAVNTRALAVRRIHAKRVVLGAGALGSTYLLMRNRGGLAGLSAALGNNMCGNGDLLGFMLNAMSPDGTPATVDGYRGPVITSTVRVERGNQLAYIQDAGFPQFMSWMIETANASKTAKRAAGILWRRVRDHLRRDWDPQIGPDLQNLVGSGALSSSSMPLLGMGIDMADGCFGLQDNRLSCDWTVDRSEGHFGMIRDTMQTICDAADADFVLNPTWLMRRVVTVHALGGCPASETPDNGVVDPWGQAHGVDGLWVVDGAALPGPVGPNPSLTIAAFADRAAEKMLEDDTD